MPFEDTVPSESAQKKKKTVYKALEVKARHDARVKQAKLQEAAKEGITTIVTRTQNADDREKWYGQSIDLLVAF